MKMVEINKILPFQILNFFTKILYFRPLKKIEKYKNTKILKIILASIIIQVSFLQENLKVKCHIIHNFCINHTLDFVPTLSNYILI